ncbi:MAG: nucleoside-triphosphatase [Atribacterota bacterium]
MNLRIVISGRPGVGKTTLVRQVHECFPKLFRGFYTEEVREKGIRMGFRIVTLSGRTGTLAARGASSPFRVGEYAVFVQEFENTAIPELEEALKFRTPCLIDELGKMEFFSQRFMEILKPLWEKVPLLLATTRFPAIPQVKEFLTQEETVLLFLTPQNREEVFTRVVQKIQTFTQGE